jgi:hypothetical protein
MGDATFNGAPQSLYCSSNNNPNGPVVFKGMAQILQERGVDTAGLNRECPGFKCKDTSSNCCIRRTLWNQPDFINVKSILEEHCEKRGIKVLFLPKFHCELNFIEQCWGTAKRVLRQYAASTQPLSHTCLSRHMSEIYPDLTAPCVQSSSHTAPVELLSHLCCAPITVSRYSDVLLSCTHGHQSS